MRETGILMPVSSLPSHTGVGELGKETEKFIGYLSASGVKIWQILPLNPVGYGNSPYQPYSSCAGDEIYISLEKLWEQKLLKELPVSELAGSTRVQYEQVRTWKETYLREAFQAFIEKGLDQTEEYQTFAAQKWVQEYGLFRAFKKANGGLCWNDWKPEHKNWPEHKTEVAKAVREEADYQIFLQYLFYCQWMEMKNAANANGIRIMGDVPFYVGVDSVDVWAGKKNFLLDTDGRPIFIAGVPPDYFSATGQRWGNPIYDWEYLKKQNYQFWVDRIGYSSRLFDIIRIDHFRGFDAYYAIPASAETAKEGTWEAGPGLDFFRAVEKVVGQRPIIAENLGFLTPSVHQLLKNTGYPGMKVLEFAFDSRDGGGRTYQPHNYPTNCVAYVGTHDNDTALGWISTASPEDVALAREYLHLDSIEGENWGMMRAIWSSTADYAIVQMQDLLGLSSEGRINTPSTLGGNWQWRALPGFDSPALAKRLLRQMKLYERLPQERKGEKS